MFKYVFITYTHSIGPQVGLNSCPVVFLIYFCLYSLSRVILLCQAYRQAGAHPSIYPIPIALQAYRRAGAFPSAYFDLSNSILSGCSRTCSGGVGEARSSYFLLKWLYPNKNSNYIGG